MGVLSIAHHDTHSLRATLECPLPVSHHQDGLCIWGRHLCTDDYNPIILIIFHKECDSPPDICDAGMV